MGTPVLSQTNNILFNTMFVVLNMCFVHGYPTINMSHVTCANVDD